MALHNGCQDTSRSGKTSTDCVKKEKKISKEQRRKKEKRDKSKAKRKDKADCRAEGKESKSEKTFYPVGKLFNYG